MPSASSVLTYTTVAMKCHHQKDYDLLTIPGTKDYEQMRLIGNFFVRNPDAVARTLVIQQGNGFGGFDTMLELDIAASSSSEYTMFANPPTALLGGVMRAIVSPVPLAAHNFETTFMMIPGEFLLTWSVA